MVALTYGYFGRAIDDHITAPCDDVLSSMIARLDYDPHLRQVKATADLSRVAGCVRGGT